MEAFQDTFTPKQMDQLFVEYSGSSSGAFVAAGMYFNIDSQKLMTQFWKFHHVIVINISKMFTQVMDPLIPIDIQIYKPISDGYSNKNLTFHLKKLQFLTYINVHPSTKKELKDKVDLMLYGDASVTMPVVSGAPYFRINTKCYMDGLTFIGARHNSRDNFIIVNPYWFYNIPIKYIYQYKTIQPSIPVPYLWSLIPPSIVGKNLMMNLNSLGYCDTKKFIKCNQLLFTRHFINQRDINHFTNMVNRDTFIPKIYNSLQKKILYAIVKYLASCISILSIIILCFFS